MTTTSSRNDLVLPTDQEAFTEMMKVIAHDMPLIMHGSGDVQPSDVNPDSALLVSELTVHYISNLVDAAMDAHGILNNGAPRLPPPPFQKSRLPPTPMPPQQQPSTTSLLLSSSSVVPSPGGATTTTTTTTTIGGTDEPTTATTTTTTTTSSSKSFDKSTKSKSNPNNNTSTTSPKKYNNKRRRRCRTDDEFWDEPLKEPTIRGKSQSTPAPVPTYEGVNIDEWVGVSGIDFRESRARKAHVAGTIAPQCFIFPICHDVGLYGKVLEVQAARRAIEPVLVDQTIMNLVRTEGAMTAASSKRDADGKARDDRRNEPEESDSEGEDGVVWPGLDHLLPVHIAKDITFVVPKDSTLTLTDD